MGDYFRGRCFYEEIRQSINQNLRKYDLGYIQFQLFEDENRTYLVIVLDYPAYECFFEKFIQVGNMMR